MKKSIIAIIGIALLLVITGTSAKGSTKPTIAVIDTGIDATHSLVSGKIVHEVCLLDFNTCPNGTNFMEGVGAATLDPARASRNGFYHGTQIASVITQNNPNVNLVVIRIIPMTANGLRASTSLTAVQRALEWVDKNHQKYNIVAVNMSQSYVSRDACTKHVPIENAINSLALKNIPSFFPTGNGSNYSKIDFPACVASSISVGATDPAYGKQMSPAIYSNNSSVTDFFALGTMFAAAPNNKTENSVGTSNSSALMAAKWVAVKELNPSLSMSQVYDRIKSQSRYLEHKRSGKMFIVDLVN
jgi:subtilisin family serine protease